MKRETLDKITAQQGKQKNQVYHCGEHLKEFLAAHPQYEDLIAADLDTPEMTLKCFEKKISAAARANGGGIGGAAADAVLRRFYGLPETDAPEQKAEIPAGIPDFSAVLV